jgi:hypothetical protein
MFVSSQIDMSERVSFYSSNFHFAFKSHFLVGILAGIYTIKDLSSSTDSYEEQVLISS